VSDDRIESNPLCLFFLQSSSRQCTHNFFFQTLLIQLTTAVTYAIFLAKISAKHLQLDVYFANLAKNNDQLIFFVAVCMQIVETFWSQTLTLV